MEIRAVGNRFVLFLLLAGCGIARGEIIVNPPVPVTLRVQVQPIIVVGATGQKATFVGDAAQEAHVKAQVNVIWAQLGVRVDWLPPVEYANAFAFDGSPGNFAITPRPGVHMDLIDDNAPTPPKNANPKVLNMFFVRIPPTFALADGYWTHGYAWIDYNGIAMYVGESLLTFPAGRDVVASVIAHEIGHNLGLSHTAKNGTDLMSEGRTANRLLPQQWATILLNHTWIDGFDLLQAVPTQSVYDQWAVTRGLRKGPEGDDDADGVANVIEFMLSMDAMAPDRMPEPEFSPNGAIWSFTKNASALAEGLIYGVEVSVDGGKWTDAGAPGSSSAVVTDDASRLTVRLDPRKGLALMRFAARRTTPVGIAGGGIEALGAIAPLGASPRHGCGCAHP